MAAGEQLFTNPMTKAAIDAYTGSLVDKSKSWIGGVSCYFSTRDKNNLIFYFHCRSNATFP